MFRCICDYQLQLLIESLVITGTCTIIFYIDDFKMISTITISLSYGITFLIMSVNVFSHVVRSITITVFCATFKATIRYALFTSSTPIFISLYPPTRSSPFNPMAWPCTPLPLACPARAPIPSVPPNPIHLPHPPFISLLTSRLPPPLHTHLRTHGTRIPPKHTIPRYIKLYNPNKCVLSQQQHTKAQSEFGLALHYGGCFGRRCVRGESLVGSKRNLVTRKVRNPHSR